MSIIFSVYDKKAESYNTPFFAETEALAKRSFVDLCRDSRTVVARNPEDFDLFVVGTFGSSNGAVAPLLPKVIMSGIEARVAAHKADQLQSELLTVADDSSKS